MYVPTYLFHSPIPPCRQSSHSPDQSAKPSPCRFRLPWRHDFLPCLCPFLPVLCVPFSAFSSRLAGCFLFSPFHGFLVLEYSHRPVRFPRSYSFFSLFFLFPPTAPRWTTTRRRSVSRADSVITLLFVRSSIRGLLEHRYSIRRSAVPARSIPSLKRRGLVPSQSWRRCPLSTCEMVFGTFLPDLDHAISWLLAE